MESCVWCIEVYGDEEIFIYVVHVQYDNCCKGSAQVSVKYMKGVELKICN